MWNFLYVSITLHSNRSFFLKYSSIKVGHYEHLFIFIFWLFFKKLHQCMHKAFKHLVSAIPNEETLDATAHMKTRQHSLFYSVIFVLPMKALLFAKEMLRRHLFHHWCNFLSQPFIWVHRLSGNQDKENFTLKATTTKTDHIWSRNRKQECMR